MVTINPYNPITRKPYKAPERLWVVVSDAGIWCATSTREKARKHAFNLKNDYNSTIKKTRILKYNLEA